VVADLKLLKDVIVPLNGQSGKTYVHQRTNLTYSVSRSLSRCTRIPNIRSAFCMRQYYFSLSHLLAKPFEFREFMSKFANPLIEISPP